VLTLPFRVPIDVGTTTSNLLVPLYLVVGAGALAYVVPTLRGARDRPHWREDGVADPEPPPGWIERLLAVVVLLYAIQAMYSPSFEKALQQMVFFYVPFALMFCLLRRLRWSLPLLKRCLCVVAALAAVFVTIGFVEYATKTLLLNPKLIAENNVHTYFAINSVFFDPDIFGRFLALVMVLVAAVLVYTRRQRDQLLAAALLAVLWAGLVLTLSRSSLGALLVGLAVLGALRWRARPVVVAGVAVVVAGIVALAISPSTFGLNQGLNGASAGRAGLIGGGARLFAERPGWGYGAGSFETEYLCRIKHLCGLQLSTSQTLSASHTIPITIAAEQGLVGEIPYVALVLVAIGALLRGARREPARAAVAAAFIALVFHTMLYADFLEDPATWTLLAIGAALVHAALPGRRVTPVRSSEAVAVA
jgi:O-antigen ligase